MLIRRYMAPPLVLLAVLCSASGQSMIDRRAPAQPVGAEGSRPGVETQKQDATVEPQGRRPEGQTTVPSDYRIGEGDIVSVSVWREPDASVASAVVRPDGKISMPLVKEFRISGLTPTEAEAAVAKELSVFINKPDVAVVVKEIHSKKVYVIGGAKKEGPIDYTYRMTILQAISEAGGLTDYAKRKKIYVLRTKDGKQQKLPFNYEAALKGERAETNIELQPGDTLVIPN